VRLRYSRRFFFFVLLPVLPLSRRGLIFACRWNDDVNALPQRARIVGLNDDGGVTYLFTLGKATLTLAEEPNYTG
jgi:hypothetical protein